MGKYRRFCLLALLGLIVVLMGPVLPSFLKVPLGITPIKVLAASLPSSLVREGMAKYEQGDFLGAIVLWEQSLSQSLSEEDRAIIFSNLALAYRQVGNLSAAIQNGDKAISIYENYQGFKNVRGEKQVAKLIVEQAQAYNDLGQHRKVIDLLQKALVISRKNKDELAEAAALGVLGNAHWGAGDYNAAIVSLQTSLKLARDVNNSGYITIALNNLGNVYLSRAERYQFQAKSAGLEGDSQEEKNLTSLGEYDTKSALSAFEESVRESQAVGGIEQVKSLLNLNRLLQKLPNPDSNRIAVNRQKILSILDRLPDSRDKVYALINLATGKINSGTNANSEFMVDAAKISILEKAITVADKIGDLRGKSFALGALGQGYELVGNYDKAMELTRQAQFAAQQINAADSLYLWQWQAGRIWQTNNNKTQANLAYQEAISTLQSIRGDLIAARKELQFDFRDSVEPVYRELISLLLDNSANKTELNIRKALDILDLLKLAELQNFFGDECVEVSRDTAQRNGKLVDKKAAIIYSIILKDRTEMILERADGSLKNYRINAGANQIDTEINLLRSLLEKRSTFEYISQTQKVYDLLIRPLEADLEKDKPETLIFINDGVLRQVPVAALHDGKQYLIEKYAIATTPSITLTTGQPLNRTNLQALIAGLTVEKPPFAALTNVAKEVSEIEKILGGTKLLDGDFTLSNLQAKLQQRNYPIVHLATHGKFGVDTASTFLLAYDTKIAVEQIDNLLRSSATDMPVELLTLSACQTAAGDNRSALGIAGVAVRAGVKTALASLWYINDEGTVPLIEEFYSQLRHPDITKAEALRQAQLKLIKDDNYNHPAVWSPFILIGNWL